MAKQRLLPDTLDSIRSLLDTMRTIQSEAEEVLHRRAARSTDGGGRAAPPGTQRGPAGSHGEPRSPLRTSIEKQLADGLTRILERLDLPSRREIEALSRRVRRLEKAIRAGPGRRPRRSAPTDS
jgi:hypothetical protein